MYDYLSKNRVGYEANSLTIAASLAILENKSFLKNYTSVIKYSLKVIKEEMKKLNIITVGGEYGNYIFIDFKNKSKCEYVTRQLLRYKIVVRDNWPRPFNTGILVSGTSKKNTKYFLKIFSQIIK